MPFHDKYNGYPHKLYRGEACMGWKAQQLVEEGQLQGAVRYYMAQVKIYSDTVGYKSAMPMAQKEKILPYLQMLADAGWPAHHAEAIIWAQDYDTKSLNRADIAFKSLEGFSLETGRKYPDAIHVGLYYIAQELKKAADEAHAKFNPYHKPAGPGGGQFDNAPGNGGGSGGGSTGGGRTDTPFTRNPDLRPASYTKPSSGGSSRPTYPSSDVSPVSHEDWKTIQDVVSSHPDLSETQTHAYSATWAMEGGFKKDTNGAVAGITQTRLNQLRADPSLSGVLDGVKTPSNLSSHPDAVPYIYNAIYDKDLLDHAGGSSALGKVGNKYAASAMADTVFREGATGGGNIIRQAVLKTDPSIKVGGPGVLKPETLKAYSILAKDPVKLGTLLDNVANARKEGPHGSETGRIDYFKFKKEVDRGQGI